MGKPIRMIECTTSDAAINRGLKYLKARFPDCEAYQISATGRKIYQSPQGIRVCDAVTFLKMLV